MTLGLNKQLNCTRKLFRLRNEEEKSRRAEEQKSRKTEEQKNGRAEEQKSRRAEEEKKKKLSSALPLFRSSALPNSLITLLFLITALITPPAPADEGKYAAEVLGIEVGARALGMGGAFVAVADDLTASYWNPAGLSQINSLSFSGMYSDLFQHAGGGFLSSGLVGYNFLGLAYPLDETSALAISWIRMGVDDIPRTTFIDANKNGRQDFEDKNNNGKKDPGEYYIERPMIATTFSESDNALFISYGTRITRNFSLGASLKLLRQTLYINRATGWGGDIGALYRNKHFGIGVAVQDFFGTRIVWDTKTNPTFTRLPNLKIGGFYALQLPIIKEILLSADLDGSRGALEADGSKLKWHLGAEYWLANLLAFRVGSEAGDLTAGTGIKFGLGSTILQADYAFASHELGGSQRISLIVGF